ncbi:MAG: peptidoglycan-binding protein, partial [Actinomycetota bacterium]
MRLIRHGQEGPEVLDIQTRLARLGYGIAPSERSYFGDTTLEAVRAFQHARGVGVDGIVGQVTWREMVDAGWTIGDRLLYLRSPMLRGDDVRELQDRLTTLGFDPGKTDGIFGPDTMQALSEFQSNYGLRADGICGPSTLRALRGLPKMSGDTPVGPLRERERMQPRPGGAVGSRVFLDPGPSGEQAAAGDTDESATLAIITMLEGLLAAEGAQVDRSRANGEFPDDSARAHLANTLEVDLVLAVRTSGDLPPGTCTVASFGHDRYQSTRGRTSAEIIADALKRNGVASETVLRTTPMLRETRAPAVVAELSAD